MSTAMMSTWQPVARRLLAPQPRPFHKPLSEAPPITVWEASSPSMSLYRHAMATKRRPLGQQPEPQPPIPADEGTVLGLGVMMIAGIIAFSVFANYQLGKAMSPSPRVEGKWAWGNAIGGTVFPPFTLGMAIYKNYFRD